MLSFLDLPLEIRLLIYKAAEPDILWHKRPPQYFIVLPHGNQLSAFQCLRLAHTCKTMRSEIACLLGSNYEDDSDWLQHAIAKTSLIWLNPLADGRWTQSTWLELHGLYREIRRIRLPQHLLKNYAPQSSEFVYRIHDIMDTCGPRERIDFVPRSYDTCWKLFNGCSVTRHFLTKHPTLYAGVSLNTKYNLLAMEANLNESVEISSATVLEKCREHGPCKLAGKSFPARTVTINLYGDLRE